MSSNEKLGLWLTVIAVAIIAVVSLFLSMPSASPEQAPDAGASTPGTRFPHGITVGDVTYSPTNLSLIQAGTCTATIVGSTLPLVSTSSIAATCAATGARAGDIVNVTLSQFGAKSASWGGFLVSGATASTDTITFNYFNGTGAATSSFPAATSSAVQYQVYRAQ